MEGWKEEGERGWFVFVVVGKEKVREGGRKGGKTEKDEEVNGAGIAREK